MNIKQKKPITRTGICLYCGKEFHTYAPKKQYCNRTCREAMYTQIRLQKAAEKKVEKECRYCHKAFISSRTYKVYCSYECKRKSLKDAEDGIDPFGKSKVRVELTKVCPYCKTTFVTHKLKQVYCRPECRYEDTIGRYKPLGRIENCPTCGTSFIVKKNGQRYCNPSCRKNMQLKKARYTFGDKLPCAFCGNVFEVRAANQKYCNSECRTRKQEEFQLQKKEKKRQRKL